MSTNKGMNCGGASCLTGTPCENLDGSCGCSTDLNVIAGGSCFPLANEPIKKDLKRIPFWSPFPIAPVNTAPNAEACSKLTAPNGYHYIWTTEKGCVMAVNYDSNTQRFPSAGTKGTGVAGAVDGIQNMLSGLSSNGKLLLLAGAGFLAWKMFAGKRQPLKTQTVSTSYGK